MSSLFGKKQTAYALAEVLADGRALFDQKMKKPNRGGYRKYHGSVPTLEIDVRVQPENEPPFEAKMKVGFTTAPLLKMGVRVQVKYDPSKKQQITLDDEIPAILERNPQLRQKQ